MKNEVNRAFMAKKRTYNQPEVQVAQFASMTLMQAASPAPAATGIPIGSGDTESQWEIIALRLSVSQEAVHKHREPSLFCHLAAEKAAREKAEAERIAAEQTSALNN